MRAVYESLPGAGYFVQVPGMFHSNFTDIPNWSPLASRLGLTGPIDGQRARSIFNQRKALHMTSQQETRAT